MKKIAIIGAGAFGFALAKYISDKLDDKKEIHKYGEYNDLKTIMIYDVDKDLIENMKLERNQKYFFPEVKLNEKVHPTTNIEEALEDSQIIILAIPTQYISSFLKDNKDNIPNKTIIVNTSKGLDIKRKKTVSEIVSEELAGKDHTYSVLSGGMIATEFVSGFGIFGAELGCDDEKIGQTLQGFFSSRRLKVYLNDDIKGIEIAGALKNVISIAVGFLDGINFPHGSKTLIISLGANEIRCISLAMDSKAYTYNVQTQSFGNDYILSTTGNTRNRYFGELIGKGMKPKDAINQMKIENKTTEGYFTSKVAYEISKEHNLNTPIMDMIYKVLYTGKDIKKSINEIMASKLEHTIDCRFQKCKN